MSGLTGGFAAVIASNPVELITFVILAIGCGWLALVDLATYRLPNRLVLPLYGIAILGLGWNAIAAADPGRLLAAVITGAAILAGYFLLGLATGRLGLGDVKLAGLIGLTLGWAGVPQTVLGVLGGFAVGAAVAAGLLITRRTDRKADFPFGPSMIAGAVLGLIFGPTILPALG
ncbi:A24 family peptidase [Microlunatus sp. Gsoil 973]|uniref:prepilin peptidase n=1 Tax=Microlunatus sp. Gsoil 973 TaxID=2672569 RepID=UPI0018A86AF1|nr:A24 family peptidase [Microlunatus sp. Gsoil 973]